MIKRRSSPAKELMRMYTLLHAHFGWRDWWPGDTAFEIMVGAILTQNTSWKNVEKALGNLKRYRVLHPQRMFDLPVKDLAELLRPAGYYNVKAKRLHAFLTLFITQFQGKHTNLFAGTVEQVRRVLLSVNGIGKETADSMLLYAGKKPIFVIDAYTKRILTRHGFVSDDADYDTMQALFMNALEHDDTLFNDFHAQIVACGNTYCKRTNPRCDECPLGKYRVGAGSTRPSRK